MDAYEVIGDFRRRYEGTYVWLSMDDCNKETLVHVDKIEDSNTKMATLNLTSQEYGQLSINYGSADHTLKFKYPPVGVFQHGNNACVFMRRPSRQYRRGLCSDNSLMQHTTRNVCGGSMNWSIDEVTSAYRHETTSLQNALNLLTKKTIRSVALANEFSLCRSPTLDSKDHLLFHWQQPVARLTKDGTISNLLEKHYEQEIHFLIGGVFK